MSQTDKGGNFSKLVESDVARPRAFHAASHHSQRVRFFRRAIIVVCVGLTALVGFVLVFDPLKSIDIGTGVDRVAVRGSKIEMNQPHLAGFRNDGQPYEITADKVDQDTNRPKIFDLKNLSARLATESGGSTKITAETGQYDSGPDSLSLRGAIRVVNDGRYDMALTSAEVDLKTGKVVVTSPIEAKLSNGVIKSQSAVYDESTGMISFQGSVTSTFAAPSDKEGASMAPQAPNSPPP